MLQADFIQRVRACERRLYRVARTMLPQECDCEDAVQEALLRAWDRLDSLKQEAAFERAVRLHAASLMQREIPPEVSDFRVGHFQVKLREDAGGARISPAARAVLLRAGLLYRGVERGM